MTKAIPSIDKTSFNCPHCGALAQQFWYNAYVDRVENNGTPLHDHLELIESLRVDRDINPVDRDELIKFFEMKDTGTLFFG